MSHQTLPQKFVPMAFHQNICRVLASWRMIQQSDCQTCSTNFARNHRSKDLPANTQFYLVHPWWGSKNMAKIRWIQCGSAVHRSFWKIETSSRWWELSTKAGKLFRIIRSSSVFSGPSNSSTIGSDTCRTTSLVRGWKSTDYWAKPIILFIRYRWYWQVGDKLIALDW